MLSLAKSKLLVMTETVKDVTSVVAVIVTLPYIAMTSGGNVVYGVEIFLWGQLAASVVTWLVTLVYVIRITGRPFMSYLADLAPYVAVTTLGLLPCALMAGAFEMQPPVLCCVEAIVFVAVYVGINALLKSRIQADVLGYLFGRFMKNKMAV